MKGHRAGWALRKQMYSRLHADCALCIPVYRKARQCLMHVMPLQSERASCIHSPSIIPLSHDSVYRCFLLPGASAAFGIPASYVQSCISAHISMSLAFMPSIHRKTSPAES